MSEFVFLQRLFRMALSGDLGPDFPIEKLVELTEISTKSKSPLAIHTLRWDSFPGQREQLLSVQIMVGLKVLGELSTVSQKESIPLGDIKRILEAPRTLLDERLQKWNEFLRGDLATSVRGG